MIFKSILFQNSQVLRKEAPECFKDLNLDQIIDAVTSGKEEYNLKPFFYTPLKEIDSIKYRQEIFQDLENNTVFESIKSFAQSMRAVREHLAQAERLHSKYHKERWFLESVEVYCEAINRLAQGLSSAAFKSCGFQAFHEYLINYINSEQYRLLLAETKKLIHDLSSVKYCLLIKGTRIKVRKYESEVDYSSIIEKTFSKFKQGGVKDYRIRFNDGPGEMNHVETALLDLVAKLYPEIFLRLDEYCIKHRDFFDETIKTFDREIQFYIAFLEFIAILKQEGLEFCYPEISDTSKEVYDEEGFDLALAYKLFFEKKSIVRNDFYLKGKERILVVTGPNQGGKTTFARTFGQLHYLASLGCPVAGRKAKLFLFDRLFTHFEKEEEIKNLHGKLQDDLIRIHSILKQATSKSILIMNEIFTSTTLQDQIFLSKKLMEKIIELDLLCVWVTFIDELASFGEQTVSMVAMVASENPMLRTYKIVRKPADGLAYAIAIAKKHRLTYDELRERIKS